MLTSKSSYIYVLNKIVYQINWYIIIELTFTLLSHIENRHFSYFN